MTRRSPASVGCMPNDLTANPQALGQASGGSKSLSNLYCEIGLAAVATELNLQLNTLDPDVVEAVHGPPPRFYSRGKLATDRLLDEITGANSHRLSHHRAARLGGHPHRRSAP